MAIQFPSPVADGYSFTASNGVVYTYDSSGGGGWYAYHPDGLDDVYVNIDGDTMTGDLTVPNLISEGNVQTFSINGGPLAGLRNQLINSNFRVWQRGTPVTVSNATGVGYGPDRWRASTNGTTMTRATGLGGGYPSAFGVRVNTPGGPGCSIAQPIELPQAGHRGPFVEGSEWTVSAYFEDPATASFQVLFATGAIGPGESWTGGDLKIHDTINGKTRVSQTFTSPASIDSARTSCLVVLQDSVNDRVFCQAQFEPGPVATPFEMRPIGLELQLCQRYYEASANIIFLQKTGITGTTNSLSTNVFLKTTKRETPTITVIGGTNVSGISALSFANGAASSFVIAGTATDGSASARCDGYTADAEL